MMRALIALLPFFIYSHHQYSNTNDSRQPTNGSLTIVPILERIVLAGFAFGRVSVDWLTVIADILRDLMMMNWYEC